MNVEREIAGISLPFAFGVLLATYISGSFNFLINTISLFIIASCIPILLYKEGFRMKQGTLWLIIAILIFACGTLCSSTSSWLSHPMPPTHIESFALKFGKQMQNAIDRIPFSDEETRALIKALLTGNKESLSPEIKNAFRSSGASHILALSGLHLGIIYAIISKPLSLCGNKFVIRRIRAIFIICVCCLYTLATGAGPSITRALIFILLRETAILSGRYHSLSQTLMASLLIQLTLYPSEIRNIGFQLSYAAMGGIAFIYPWLKRLWKPSLNSDSKESHSDDSQTRAGKILTSATGWVWNSAALSISCQITTGPLAYIYFHSFPQHFLLTNLISLPLTGIIIPCALLTLIMSCIGYCPQVLLWLTEQLIRTLTWSLQVISTM